MTVQAGFIGPWGEWHGSTNFNYDADGRKEVVRALMGAVPDRNVQIRTPQHKKNLYTDCDILHSSGHVSNGGFEGTVGSPWGSYSSGYTVSTTDFNGGTQSVKVTNGAASQVITLTASEGYRVEISGFSKRVGESIIVNDAFVYVSTSRSLCPSFPMPSCIQCSHWCSSVGLQHLRRSVKSTKTSILIH